MDFRFANCDLRLGKAGALLAIVLAAVLGGGCSSTGGSITVSSPELKQQFTQEFRTGYAGSFVRGDYDVILLEDAAQEAPKGDPKAPIAALAVAAQRHILHIHIYARAETRMRADHPAAVNSTLTWYTLEDGSRGTPGRIVREGAGLAILSGSPPAMQIEIANAQLTTSLTSGNLADTIGRASLRGTANVTRDDQRVNELLDELEKIKAAATQPAGR